MSTTATKEMTIDFAPPIAESSTVPAVVEAAPPAPVIGDTSPILGLIERASRDPNVDIDKMERLIAMHERVKADAARVEFDNAMAAAQAEMQPIRANMENEHTNSEYADQAALDRAIRPIYTKHGFSLSFNTASGGPDGCIRLVCIVAHRGGHREPYQIDMPSDGKGARGNDVMTKTHATGAATTYGKRYLHGMIWNLAVSRDDDGNAAGNGDWVDEADRDGLLKNGERRSTYNVEVANKTQKWADEAIQYLNYCNAHQAKEWRREKQTLEKGKRKTPLQWLSDNSPGQYVRVQQTYQNVTGEDLE